MMNDYEHGEGHSQKTFTGLFGIFSKMEGGGVFPIPKKIILNIARIANAVQCHN